MIPVLRTWHLEMISVGLALAAVAVLFNSSLSGWLSVAAVVCSFGHASVSDRLDELERKTSEQGLEIARLTFGEPK